MSGVNLSLIMLTHTSLCLTRTPVPRPGGYYLREGEMYVPFTKGYFVIFLAVFYVKL